MAQWNMPARIYPRLNFLSLLVGPSAVLIVTTFAAIFPILRVKHLQPVEAMRSA
jgi:ABC-type lipoprotein release transport system permease subunit